MTFPIWKKGGFLLFKKLREKRKLSSAKNFLFFLYDVVYVDIEQYEKKSVGDIIDDCKNYAESITTLSDSAEKQETLSALFKAQEYLKTFL